MSDYYIFQSFYDVGERPGRGGAVRGGAGEKVRLIIGPITRNVRAAAAS